MGSLCTIRDVDWDRKTALVRVDFNVPMKDGVVADDTRIRAALPTISYLREHGARVVLMSHLGRPDGQPNPKYSLEPVAERLGQLLKVRCPFAADCVGQTAEAAVSMLRPGDVLMLENVRFHPEEEENDAAFAKQLAALGGVFVNDAFGTAHRAHASTEGVAHLLPAVAGLLMEKEIVTIGSALESPRRPFIAVIGGAKVSTKLAVLNNLLHRVDRLLIGGGMANTFLKAEGIEVGRSLLQSRQPSPDTDTSLADLIGHRISEMLETQGGEPHNIYQKLITELERPLIQMTLKRVRGNQVHAARILGLNRNTLRKKLVEHGISITKPSA